MAGLRRFEGHRVTVVLKDGVRFEDCTLITLASRDTGKVWIYSHPHDFFFAPEHIAGVWERPLPRRGI